MEHGYFSSNKKNKAAIIAIAITSPPKQMKSPPEISSSTKLRILSSNPS